MKTILVTGVGAIIGYGILKSLRSYDPNLRLIGTDIYADAVGQNWADAFMKAPLTSAPEYTDWLLHLTESNKVDLIIPGIEQDLHFLSDHRNLFENKKTKLAINNKDLVDITKDKWQFYQSCKMHHPEVCIPTYDTGTFAELAKKLTLPFIVKPKKSYASKGLIRISNEDDLDVAGSFLGKKLIAQPIIGSNDNEYTVATFCSTPGECTASIILRRTLAKDGSTSHAYTYDDPELTEIIHRLCKTYMSIGPANMQFRKDEEGWKILEINPRVSSSTSIRLAFGYNESAMCIQHFLDGNRVSQPTLRSGKASRYIEDCVSYDNSHNI